jgi:hypothetical protein
VSPSGVRIVSIEAAGKESMELALVEEVLLQEDAMVQNEIFNGRHKVKAGIRSHMCRPLRLSSGDEVNAKERASYRKSVNVELSSSPIYRAYLSLRKTCASRYNGRP